MTAKEFMRQYEEACKRAIRYKAEYEAERELIDAVRSTLGGDGLPHGTGISRKVEDQAIRLQEKAMRCKEAELEAIRVRQIVFDVIDLVPGTMGDVLFERYIRFKKWHEVAETVHLSERQINNIHRDALKFVDDFLEFPTVYK